MHNNYIKELAIKSYQEDIQKEYYLAKQQTWHLPSFMLGIVLSQLIFGWLF